MDQEPPKVTLRRSMGIIYMLCFVVLIGAGALLVRGQQEAALTVVVLAVLGAVFAFLLDRRTQRPPTEQTRPKG